MAHTPDWWELVPGWVDEYYRIAGDARPRSHVLDVDQPRVHFRLTGKKAGYCRYATREIALNPAMDREQAHRTLAHELAHYFAFYVDGHAGHGPAFAQWMRDLGHVPSRCHNYANVIETGRGDWWHCNKCGFEIKTIRRNMDGRYHRGCGRSSSFNPGRAGELAGKRLAYKLAAATLTVAAENPAEPLVETGSTPGEAIRGLRLELEVLRDGGQGSSAHAKRIRRQLRKLGHRGGTR